MTSFQEYIHRVGRTARGEGGQGHALLILRPEELGFLRYLRQAKVTLTELEFSWNKISNIQPQVSTCHPFCHLLRDSCIVSLLISGKPADEPPPVNTEWFGSVKGSNMKPLNFPSLFSFSEICASIS